MAFISAAPIRRRPCGRGSYVSPLSIEVFCFMAAVSILPVMIVFPMNHKLSLLLIYAIFTAGIILLLFYFLFEKLRAYGSFNMSPKFFFNYALLSTSAGAMFALGTSLKMNQKIKLISSFLLYFFAIWIFYFFAHYLHRVFDRFFQTTLTEN